MISPSMFDHLHSMSGSCLLTTLLEPSGKCFRSSSSSSSRTWHPSTKITVRLPRVPLVTWLKNLASAFFQSSCPFSTKASRLVPTNRDKASALDSQKSSLLLARIWSLLWLQMSDLLLRLPSPIRMRMYGNMPQLLSTFFIISSEHRLGTY